MKCFQVSKNAVQHGIDVVRPLFGRQATLVKVGEKKIPLAGALSVSAASFEKGLLVLADYRGSGDALELVEVGAVQEGGDAESPSEFGPIERDDCALVRFSLDLQLHGRDELKLDCAPAQAHLLAYHRKQHVAGHVGFGAGAGITLVYHTSEGLICMEPGSQVLIIDKARYEVPTGLFGWLRGDEPEYQYQTVRTTISYDGDKVTVVTLPDRLHNY